MKQRVRSVLVFVFPFALAHCSEPVERPVIGVVVSGNAIQAAKVAGDVINRAAAARDSILLELHQSIAPLSAESAITFAVRFAAKPRALAVVGHANSSASLAAAQIYNQEGIVQIAPTTSAPLYSQSGPYSFSMVPDDRAQARFLVQHILRDSSIESIAVAYANDDYGRGLWSYVRDMLTGSRIRIVTVFPHLSDARFEDMERLAAELKAHKPDLLLWLSRPFPLQRLLSNDDLGVRILGSDALESTVTYANPKGVFTGVEFVRFFDPGSTNPQLEDFQQRYRRYTSDPVTAEAIYTYDAIVLLASGIRFGARTPEQLRDYIAATGVSRRSFAGLGGPVHFDSTGAAVREYRLARIGERH